MEVLALGMAMGLSLAEADEIPRRAWFLRHASYAVIPNAKWRLHVSKEIDEYRKESNRPEGYYRELERFLVGPYYLDAVPNELRWRMEKLTTEELKHVESHGQFGILPNPAKFQYMNNDLQSFCRHRFSLGREEFDRLRTLD